MTAAQPEKASGEAVLCESGDGMQLRFDALPLWQGVQMAAGIREVLPLWLGWDPAGFIRQVTPDAVRDRVVGAYATEDYQFITKPPGDSAWADRLGQEKIAALEQHIGPLGGLRIMEIGAGSLFVAERLLKRHDIASYIVVDPALGAKSADPRLVVIKDYFPCDAIQASPCDLVMAFSCLEHAGDAKNFLMALRRALSPEGRAFLTLPDVGRQFAEGDLCALVHEHLTYLDRAGLEALFAAAGLDLLTVESRHDMFYCVAKPAAVVRCAAPRSDAVLADAATAFHGTITTVAGRVRSEFAQGMTLVFHGANAGLNNFLYLAGLAGSARVVVFDGDASKVGAYLPACPSVIRAVADPSYGDADRVYVAATSFFDEIARGLTGTVGFDRQKIVPLFGAPS